MSEFEQGKNVFGGIGLILLVGICLIPIIKIMSIILVFGRHRVCKCQLRLI